jgi:hypothetical protein
MKHRSSTLLAALACAALALALAPTTPTAIAGGGYYGHDLDEEAQQWYDFANEKAQEINLLHIRIAHSIESKTYRAYHSIERYCPPPCLTRPPVDQNAARRRSIARKARFSIGKCAWEAHMELDACYEDARAQLEAAGYGYFVTHIYTPYRTTQRWVHQFQRKSNHVLACAVNCTIDNVGL